ncbi:MAG: hypothetical protein M3161_02130 [Actinomycetota bacterium]|nr:hypothetical protein [Actinomycetota bacterium]
MRRTLARKVTVAVVAAGAVLNASAVLAHPHKASPAHQGEGQEVANGQNHGPFTLNEDGYAETQTDEGDPAAYGIETAHHGPDSGRPGKADGKYQTDATATSGASGPGSDDNNPAIQ